MTIKVFYTSVSGCLELKKKQDRMFMILDGKKIKYEPVDISQNEKDKILMRELVGNSKALPPQIVNGSDYCGDYNAFENAIEDEALERFLKL